MKVRSQTGSQMAEFPAAIAVLFLFVFFILVDLSTLMLGVNNVHNAARVGASDGARGTTFDDIQTRAKAQVANIAGGVVIKNVDVVVMEVPIKDSIPDPDDSSKTVALTTSQILPGPTPVIDTSSYQYQVKVTVQATVSPMVNLTSINGMISVPGLTMPMPVTATYTSQAEHPKALGD